MVQCCRSEPKSGHRCTSICLHGRFHQYFRVALQCAHRVAAYDNHKHSTALCSPCGHSPQAERISGLDCAESRAGPVPCASRARINAATRALGCTLLLGLASGRSYSMLDLCAVGAELAAVHAPSSASASDFPTLVPFGKSL